MNSTKRNTIATGLAGVAIAAGSFALTGQGTSISIDSLDRGLSVAMSSAYDSFGSAGQAVSVGDRDNVGTGHRERGTTSSRSSSTIGHEGSRQQVTTVGQAPSSDRSSRPSRENLTDLHLDGVVPTGISVTHLDVDCDSGSVLDLSVRQAAECGLDAGDWALVNVTNAYNQARASVTAAGTAVKATVTNTTTYVQDTADLATERVVDVADSTIEVAGNAVDAAASAATSTVNSAVDTTVGAVTTTTARVVDTASCTAGVAGNVLDASGNQIVRCA